MDKNQNTGARNKAVISVLTVLMAASTVLVAWMKKDQVSEEFIQEQNKELRSDVDSMVNSQLNAFIQELHTQGREFVDNEFTMLLEDLAKLQADVAYLMAEDPANQELPQLHDEIRQLSNWTKDQKVKSEARKRTDEIKKAVEQITF